MGYPIRNFFFLIFSSSCLLGTAGCNGEEGISNPEQPKVRVLECEGTEPDVDIYYDATPSMMGYLNDSRFVEVAVFDLENAIPVGSKIHFYKATSIARGGIEIVQERMVPSRPEFYDSGNTDLATIIDSSNTEHLSIIVTDLFQTDNDINRVANLITEKYVQSGQAIGVAGALYSFEGTIYDIGLERRSRKYEGPRPLYLLALGNHCAIASFFDQLRSSIDDNFHTEIFSPVLVKSPIGFGRVSWYDNLVQDRFGPAESEYLVQLKIRNNSSSASFKAPLGVDWAPYVVQPPRSAWAFEIQCEHQPDLPCSGEESRAVELKVEQQNGGAALQVHIDPVRLQRTIYEYTITISPGNLPAPRWAKEWNIDLTTIQAGEFQGDKTQYLTRFLQRLQSDIKGYNTPRLGQLRVYVKKER